MDKPRRRPFRLWVIGLACYLAGVTTYFYILAFPANGDSMDDFVQFTLLAPWLAIALFLIVVDLKRSPGNRIGWVFWWLALFGAWYMAANTFPDK